VPSAKKARKETDKVARRGVLLDAARTLLDEAPYQSVTMAAVAERAGLAKGTVYLYYASKEELFLELLVSLRDAWFTDVDTRLDSSTPGLTPNALILLFASSLQRRENLVKLLAIVSTLESGLGVEAARDYKRRLWARLTTTGARLEARFPGLEAGGGFRLLMHLWALIVGMHQLSEPSPLIRSAIVELGLEEFQFDFFTELGFVLLRLLESLHRERPQTPSRKRDARRRNEPKTRSRR
jgi:AcrR family transcriptional regulator